MAEDAGSTRTLANPSLFLAAGWEAVMRIRCSKGIRVNKFHGHFFIQSTDLMSMPQVWPRVAHFAG